MKKKKYSDTSMPEKVQLVWAWLDEKKAQDILALDVRPITVAAEAMVLATASTARHAQALADWLLQKTAEANFEFLGMEGTKTGRWILVDLNDVIVHILQEEARDYYNLEGLWSGADQLPTPVGLPAAKDASAGGDDA